MKAVAVGLASLLLSALLIAQPDAAITATGTFRTEFVSFTVQSAIAYVGKSALDTSEPALVVAISNAWVDPDGIADFVDRRRAIEKLINDGDTGVVYLEFTPEGAYRGLSYAFGPDDGCGFCLSEATSTVTLENGRLVGRVTSSGNNRPFDVNLDVSLMSDDHGAALPTGGGEPGRAFLAYHGSLVNRDPVALRSTISLRRVDVWNRASRGGVLDQYLEYLASEHPMDWIKITDGWVLADRASLLFVGESSGGPIHGEVLLLREEGVWRVEQEVTE